MQALRDLGWPRLVPASRIHAANATSDLKKRRSVKSLYDQKSKTKIPYGLERRSSEPFDPCTLERRSQGKDDQGGRSPILQPIRKLSPRPEEDSCCLTTGFPEKTQEAVLNPAGESETDRTRQPASPILEGLPQPPESSMVPLAPFPGMCYSSDSSFKNLMRYIQNLQPAKLKVHLAHITRSPNHHL
jgi:hypothetical protein